MRPFDTMDTWTPCRWPGISSNAKVLLSSGETEDRRLNLASGMAGHCCRAGVQYMSPRDVPEHT